MTKKKLGFN